ncbi:GIY-YIG nuclease superfamily protein [Planctomycetes bacterium Poly30]|uniref:GIY-YIG nuclease superfamily protein n=1 Tax=Saltatorellus ferox TaxID=2528018 RepID=A0A518EPE7_9BACT|nr:GIY-YIG nuclease superfamily protein [Planctomycetes bacterium Poly30]
MTEELASDWFVYVLQSEARSVTYVGIARDVDARLAQHNGEVRGGAKSTRAARPWKLARTEGPYPSRGEAQVREYALKQLRGPARLQP